MVHYLKEADGMITVMDVSLEQDQDEMECISAAQFVKTIFILFGFHDISSAT